MNPHFSSLTRNPVPSERFRVWQYWRTLCLFCRHERLAQKYRLHRESRYSARFMYVDVLYSILMCTYVLNFCRNIYTDTLRRYPRAFFNPLQVSPSTVAACYVVGYDTLALNTVTQSCGLPLHLVNSSGTPCMKMMYNLSLIHI